MGHGLLTLFNRSVRMDARGVKGHAFRVAFALFIYFSLLSAYLSSLSFGAPGLRFFSSICYLNLFFIGLAGVSFFATAVTEEKEEQTIGLLRMAGMSRAAILLGKSTSRLLSSALLLVIQFPFLLLAITLGGVTYWQVIAAAVSLGTFLAFTANAALLFSVICQRSGSAVGFSALAILARFFGPWLLSIAVGALATAARVPASFIAPLENFSAWFAQTSPTMRLGSIMTTGFAESLLNPQVVFDLAASVVCFALAWVLFDRFTQDEKAGEPSRGLLLRKPGRMRWLTAGRVWRDPLVWKDFHFLAGGFPVLFGKTIAYAVIAVLIGAFMVYESRSTVTLDDIGVAVLWAMVIAAVIELAVLASRVLHDEWKHKTLDALLLLPRPFRRLGWSKTLGCLIALVPAVGVMFAACVVSPTALTAVGEAVTSPLAWAFVLSFVTFLHLTTLLSLFVRWGALPLAFLVYVVAGYALTPVLILSIAFAAAFESEEAGALPVCGLQLGLSAILQLLIAKRVEVLGGR